MSNRALASTLPKKKDLPHLGAISSSRSREPPNNENRRVNRDVQGTKKGGRERPPAKHAGARLRFPKKRGRKPG